MKDLRKAVKILRAAAVPPRNGVYGMRVTKIVKTRGGLMGFGPIVDLWSLPPEILTRKNL